MSVLYLLLICYQIQILVITTAQQAENHPDGVIVEYIEKFYKAFKTNHSFKFLSDNKTFSLTANDQKNDEGNMVSPINPIAKKKEEPVQAENSKEQSNEPNLVKSREWTGGKDKNKESKKRSKKKKSKKSEESKETDEDEESGEQKARKSARKHSPVRINSTAMNLGVNNRRTSLTAMDAGAPNPDNSTAIKWP